MAALLNLNVLLAEDDENDVILIRRALKDLDCVGRLMVVRDGEEVLSYLQGAGPYADRSLWPLPGVLVLDHKMPLLLGMDVVCWIRSEPRFSKLPVVLWSGALTPAEQTMLTGLQAGFCPKNVEIQQSARLLEEAMVDALTLVRGGWFRDTYDSRPVHAGLVPIAN
jgi:CheY-like chemotaxis protein